MPPGERSRMTCRVGGAILAASALAEIQIERTGAKMAVYHLWGEI